MDRRRFMITAAAIAASAPAARLAADPTSPAARGREFLASLYEPQMRLLPEFRGSKTYWLFHDNYLAAKVLARSNPDLARQIESRTRELGVVESGKIEIVFGEAKSPLPFRQYSLDVVERVGDREIKTERAVGGPFKGWEKYADLLLLAAIAESKSEPARARERFDAAITMWDGLGVNDAVVKVRKQYATYKLALAMIAAARVGAGAALPAGIQARLLAMQGAEGGWITDYLPDGAPHGLANVETTCLAILGLEAGPS